MEGLLAKVTAATESQEKEVARKRSAVTDSEGRLQKEEAQLKKQEEALHQIALLLAQLEATLQALVNDLSERHRATFEVLIEDGVEAVSGIEQAEKQIRAIKQTLEAAGAVNMTRLKSAPGIKSAINS